jgi:signal transduction histidine kinase/CheY-like chemotaxis protein
MVNGLMAAADLTQRSERELRNLLENLPAGAYTCDADGLITYFNGAAQEIWGRSPTLNSPTDRYCGSLRLFTSPGGEQLPHVESWVARTLRTNRGYNGQELIIERPDGKRRTVLAHANPLRNEFGNVVGAVNVLVDITKRKAAEDALLATDRMKDEFLGTLAHELRNPLAPIRLAVDMLRLNATDPQAAIDVIDRQVSVITRLVDDLMDVSRVARGRLALTRERVSLASVMRAALDASLPLLEAAGHKLEVNLPPASVEVMADPARLAQAFSNLLNNAAKYTPLGGSVTFEARVAGGRVAIRVCDTGVGISRDLLPHIFDLFGSSRGAPSRPQGGLGVGLALVKHLITVQGGTVRATCEGVGRGAEFVDDLPVALPLRSAETPVAMPAAAPATESHRILVVDDNRDAADGLAMLLRLRGNDVRVAYSGSQALEVAAQFQPEVGVLDIGMPEMNGYEVARELRTYEWGRDAILIALTGWGQEHDEHNATARGFDHHFVKPARPAELAACWQRLERRRAATPQKNQRMLVVDDHPHVADSIASVLRYLGGDVGTVYDGKAALDTVREFKPSILFLDLEMPGMSGYDVAREIRANPETRDITVIAVSGWGDGSNSGRMKDAGFDHSLTKPTDINTLEDLLAKIAR